VLLQESEIDGTEEGAKMNEKINPGFSRATSCSQGKTKYVLEDVFWVPISNCSSRHFTLPAFIEPHSKKPVIGEVSGSDESETLASGTAASLVQRPANLSRVRPRSAQSRDQRGHAAVTDEEKH
jgi:hypothetical protein